MDSKAEFFAQFEPDLKALRAAPMRTLTLADLNRDLPKDHDLRSTWGVYAIWEGPRRFLYVGIVMTVPAGSPGLMVEPKARGVAATAQGLFGRLRDHAQGNAKDPVWRAYAERCVIPRLTRPQLDELAEGRRLDTFTRPLVKGGQFQYQATSTSSTARARAMETGIRRYGLPPEGLLPELNASHA